MAVVVAVGGNGGGGGAREGMGIICSGLRLSVLAINSFRGPSLPAWRGF